MTDPTVRPLNALALFKIESTEGVDASPAAATDAFPFELDSVSFNSPWKAESTNEVTGSLVAGAPLVLGQPFTISFRARIKGANATYSASVKPPHHALLQACGKRGVFQAAIATAVLTAGSTTSATLGTGYTGTAQLYRGMRAVITAGVGVGAHPLIADYTAGKVATLADLMASALDVTTSIQILANWTYAGTSPADFATRLTDHPSGTLYYYEDGILHKGLAMRGKVTLDGDNAGPGYFNFEMTGIYGGRSAASVPSGAVIASQAAPVLVQGSAVSSALVVNRKALPISKWSIEDGGEVISPDDPNTTYGFGGATIGGRSPMLKIDPLMTQLSTRDHLAEVAAGGIQTAALRCGTTSGNRWAITIPQALPMAADPGKRGSLRSEDFQLQLLTPGKDSNTRDGDYIICFD